MTFKELALGSYFIHGRRRWMKLSHGGLARRYNLSGLPVLKDFDVETVVESTT